MWISALPWDQGAGMGARVSVGHSSNPWAWGQNPLGLQELTTGETPFLSPSPSPAGHVDQHLTTLVVVTAGTSMRDCPSGATMILPFPVQSTKTR